MLNLGVIIGLIKGFINPIKTAIEGINDTLEDLVGTGTYITLVNLLGAEGKFSPDWMNTYGGTHTTANEELTIATTVQYGGARTVSAYTFFASHKYFLYGQIKTSATKAHLSTNGSGGVGAYALGTGEWEDVYFYGNPTGDREQPITITEDSSTIGTPVTVRKVVFIDLTACYGAGNEPSASDILDIVKENAWFSSIQIKEGGEDGQIDLIKNRITSVEDTLSKRKSLSDCTVLIFGDSITKTHTIGANGSLTYSKTNWTKHAMDILGIDNWYNFAQDGATWHDWNCGDTYCTFKKQFDLAKTKQIDPDIVIVSLGTNDYQYAHTDTFDDVIVVQDIDTLDRTNLYGALRWAMWSITNEYPDAVVYICTPISRPDFTAGVGAYMVEAITSMAEMYGYKVINGKSTSGLNVQNETWGASGRYTSDGLHPNETGKLIMGQNYANAIKDMYPLKET